MAIDDEVVVGYPVEKVRFQKEANNTVNPSVGMASTCVCLCVCVHVCACVCRGNVALKGI